MGQDKDTVNIAHRPGLFKLPNKKHKTGQHRSKREVSRDNKGKLGGVRIQSLKRSRKVDKAQRRNQIRQLWAQKRDQLLEKMSIQGSPNNRSPFIVTIISLDKRFSAENIVKCFADADSEGILTKSAWGPTFLLNLPRLRMRFMFTCPAPGDIIGTLDCLRVTETMLIVWPLGEASLTPCNSKLLTAAMAQGLPVALHAIVGLPINGKLRDQQRKCLDKCMGQWPPFHDQRAHNLDSSADAFKMLRLLAAVRKRPSILQQLHPHLLAERVIFSDENLEENTCTLQVTGFLRGAPLNINKRVDVPGFGNFRLCKVEVQSETIDDRSTVTLLPTASELLKVNGEHEAMEIDEKSSEIDEFNTDFEDESDTNEKDEDNFSDSEFAQSEIEDVNDSIVTDQNDDPQSGVDAKLFREARLNAQWPDETETPTDVPARERFIAYRGLKSFRTSPWDPNENLPREYAQIYKFSDFKRTKKNVLSEIRATFLTYRDESNKINSNELVFPGSYVTLHISDVPLSAKVELLLNRALVVFGLLTHEEKTSVLNMVLEKHSSCRIPLKNRDSLIFQVGFRLFEARALFSQHNNGNKFKMERFMPTEGTFCASVLAPICIPPASVIVFLRDANNTLSVVASGNVLDLNPDRIVLKRVVLSGHPFKINKRLAIVRYMFFNKEDADWFKPVEVYTPRGRRGYIKESLGTHGLIKCIFDQPLSVQDSVMMNLYKRVFPKFSYTPRVPLTAIKDKEEDKSNNYEGTLVNMEE